MRQEGSTACNKVADGVANTLFGFVVLFVWLLLSIHEVLPMEIRLADSTLAQWRNSAYIAVECVYAPIRGGFSVRSSRRPEPARPVEPTRLDNPSRDPEPPRQGEVCDPF